MDEKGDILNMICYLSKNEIESFHILILCIIKYSKIKIKYFTGKEPDPETGLYYFGARYLDPKTARWLSVDPAMGEYFPSAPVNDEARRRNGNLRGEGGIFNPVNFNYYHYGSNNPIRFTDPDGEADWDMVGRGVMKTIKGVIKIKGGVSIFTASGAGAIVSGGAATPIAVIGLIASCGLVADGFVQAGIGIAETIAGLTANDPITDDIKNSIPNTLTGILGSTADSVITAASGEPSTIMQDAANVVDTIQDQITAKGRIVNVNSTILTSPEKLLLKE